MCGTPPTEQDAVDPAYGNEVLAALRKEVQRLTHTAGELARGQEALVQVRRVRLGMSGMREGRASLYDGWEPGSCMAQQGMINTLARRMASRVHCPLPDSCRKWSERWPSGRSSAPRCVRKAVGQKER